MFTYKALRKLSSRTGSGKRGQELSLGLSLPLASVLRSLLWLTFPSVCSAEETIRNPKGLHKRMFTRARVGHAGGMAMECHPRFPCRSGVLVPPAYWGIGDSWLVSHSVSLQAKGELVSVTLPEANAPK